MYELNRARLVGIGPRGARFTDVTLDLSGVGDEPRGKRTGKDRARRPSPFSLLLLENGGGKSVLLKLVFSVVLPGRRRTVGGAALDQFVLDTDTGHVALEWMHVVTGERIVTAKVFQPRSKTASDGNPMSEAWYSFRPSSALSLESLPVVLDGRRRRLDAYRHAVEEANRESPATQLAWIGSDQGRWTATLREHGIEPDLFDIQRRMNIDEGEAAKVFKFTSSRDFVNWLLEIVTDAEDAVSVADTFAEWAATFAAREQMLLERDFLEGAIVGLDTVTAANQDHLRAASEHSAAQSEAERLAIALILRTQREQVEVGRLAEEFAAAGRSVVTRTTERDSARETLNEVRLQTLLLMHAHAEESAARAQERIAAARTDVASWELLPQVAARDKAIARAEALAAQVAAADEEAAPLLQRRDATAARLLAKYDEEADAADLRARERDAAAISDDAEASAALQGYAQATSQLATAEEQRRSALAQAANSESRLLAAIGEGIVPADSVASDVRRLADDAREQRDARESKREEAIAAALRSRSAAAETERAAQDAALRHRDLAKKSSDAHTALAATEDPATAIADDPAIRDLLGEDEDHDEGDPASIIDSSAERLLPLLASAVTELDAEDARLRVAQKEGDRILDALGDGGLLPPRPEVERVTETLRTAGIAAYSGWQYLHDAVPASARAAAINAHPDAVDGVALADAADIDRAARILTDARLLPSAAIAVVPGAALIPAHSGNEEGDGVRAYVVPPTPALFDEDVAADQREILAAEADSRAARLETVADRLGRTREIYRDLNNWRSRNPHGQLSLLRSAAVAADQASVRAEQAVAAADEAHVAASAARDVAADAAEAAGTALRAADLLATNRSTLADVVDSAGEAIRAIAQLDADIANYRAEASTFDRQREAAALRAQAARDDAARERLTAGQFRKERAEVPSTSGDRAPEAPPEPLSALRLAAHAANEAYAAARAVPDLRASADAAAVDAQRSRNELATRDPDHVAAAERLFATPHGADEALWPLKSADARTELQAQEVISTDVQATVATLESDIRNARPTEAGRSNWTVLAEAFRPTTAGHGRQLEVRAQEIYAAAQTVLDDAERDHRRLEREHAAGSESVRALSAALVPLETELRTLPNPAGQSEVPEHGGPADQAESLARGAVKTLQTAADSLAVALTDLREATRDLNQFAGQERYQHLQSHARRSILEAGDPLLAGHAAEWASSLRSRIATLTLDIENSERYRRTIIERLSALVEQALKTLRRATRLSRLPDDLDEWSGHPFLRIRFSEPDATSVQVRVGEVIDRAADEFAGRTVGRTGRSKAARRDGMGLLLEGVHASVPKGFAVDILKPDSVLRDERVSIEEMNAVFSGGQELTAAIVLYCTIASLRANDLGYTGNRHAGVLFLDNPIGRANAAYLMDLQKSVARSLGVQLIYTTGISDDRVLAAFPLWVRLRNDADLRAGLKHIRVAEAFREQLPPPYAETEASGDGMVGTVSAARVMRQTASATEGNLLEDVENNP